MLQSFKNFIYTRIFKSEHSRHIDLVNKYKSKVSTLKEQNRKIQLYETMLADKNAASAIAQTIHVTDHAVHRYIERINRNILPDEARKLIYKRTLSLLATLDKLPDGKYDITKEATIRIKNNTVCTVVKRKH